MSKCQDHKNLLKIKDSNQDQKGLSHFISGIHVCSIIWLVIFPQKHLSDLYKVRILLINFFFQRSLDWTI